jgi:hypothetical protein
LKLKNYSKLLNKVLLHIYGTYFTPVQFYSGSTTTSNGYYTETKPANSFPIGLIVGPGLAGGNMIAASSANNLKMN